MINEEKRARWLQARIGYITASGLEKLGEPGKKIGKTTQSYLYEIQKQRLWGVPEDPVYSRPMSIGIENEPLALEWLRESNQLIGDIVSCSDDYDDIIFKPVDWARFGSSPDSFLMIGGNIKALIEVKCVVGVEKNWLFSPTVPYQKKRASVFEQHCHQLTGELLSYPEIETIYLLKYLPQIDENRFDMDSPLHPRRGILFEYSRLEFGTMFMKSQRRIEFCDKFIDSGYDIDEIEVYRLLEDKEI